MVEQLIDLLYNQLGQFCLKASRSEGSMYQHDAVALHLVARRLLRRANTSGEAGEILIYFLIEAILEAPQLVAKMDLKTNTRFESLGADGLHFKWNPDGKFLDIYCAESKLEMRVSKAVSNLVKSLKKFHLQEDHKNELRLATAHFKHADEQMKGFVTRVLQNRELGITYRLRHACLVGYNWNRYEGLAGSDVMDREAEFRSAYTADRPKLLQLLEKHFHQAADAAGSLVAFEVFFLPFESVQDFRTKFNMLVDC